VVLVSPAGVVLRDTLPVDVQFDTRVTWTDDEHLNVFAAGRTFTFIADGPQLRETTLPKN